MSRLDLACIGIALTALAGASLADTLEVPEEFPTIQAAIDAAVDGDEVVVADGVYVETIDFLGKAIVVRSANSPALAVIDAAGGGSAVSLVNGEGPDSALEGFTITGGSGTAIDGFSYGGGLLISASSPVISDCVFTINQAQRGGGAACLAGSEPAFTDCHFQGNAASHYGGGLFIRRSSPSLSGCAFDMNIAAFFGGGVRAESDSHPTFNQCLFTSNQGSEGGGMFNQWGCDPLLMGCQFISNSATGWGGGMYTLDGGAPLVVGCTFLSNEAGGHGGGMMNHNQAVTLAVNCLFAGNVANNGGAVLNHSDAPPTLVNCTIVDNVAKQTGGGFYHLNNHCTIGNAQLQNCVVWGNAPDQIVQNNGNCVTVTHCLVQDGWESGENNISDNPLFFDPDGPDNDPATLADNDYRLLPGSPAIDAGSNNAVPVGITADLAGNPRFVDDPATPDCPFAPGECGRAPIVDIGAYELQKGKPWLNFVYPNGLPGSFVTPSAAITIEVAIIGFEGAMVEPDTATLHLSLNGAPFEPSTLVPVGRSDFLAQLPAIGCFDEVSFFFSAQSTGGQTFFDPAQAPQVSYSSVAASGSEIIFEDQMEGDVSLWSVDNDLSLTSGAWEHAAPIGTMSGNALAAPEEDATIGTGTLAFITENGRPGGAPQDSDVDGGPTRLISPVFNLEASDAIISWSQWYFCNDDPADALVIDLSNDGGSSWITARTFTSSESAWVYESVRVSEHVQPTAEVRTRFSVADTPNNSVTEAGIDDFKVERLICCAGQSADLDGDGVVGPADLAALLANWGPCAPERFCPGDVNGDGAVNAYDLAALLANWGDC